MVIGTSIAFAWLRLRSGSLWPAVLLHAPDGDDAVHAVCDGEFGLGLALVALPVADHARPRPWQPRWGASAAEVIRTMLGVIV